MLLQETFIYNFTILKSVKQLTSQSLLVIFPAHIISLLLIIALMIVQILFLIINNGVERFHCLLSKYSFGP